MSVHTLWTFLESYEEHLAHCAVECPTNLCDPKRPLVHEKLRFYIFCSKMRTNWSTEFLKIVLKRSKAKKQLLCIMHYALCSYKDSMCVKKAFKGGLTKR